MLNCQQYIAEGKIFHSGCAASLESIFSFQMHTHCNFVDKAEKPILCTIADFDLFNHELEEGVAHGEGRPCLYNFC